MIQMRVQARAPLRLGFGGGGTDVSPYCDTFGGAVLNAAIDLFAHVTVETRADGRLRLTAADRDADWTGPASLDGDTPAAVRLLQGAYARCMREFADGQALPLSISARADCPPGSGLGSSSALVVALVEALRRITGAERSPDQVARLAFSIEREDLGLAGGRQDQWAAAKGGVNLMRFEPGGAVQVEPAQATASALRALEASLLLYFTGVSRDSAAIIEAQSANMTAGDPAALAGLHALKAGAFAMHDALAAGDLARFGALMNQGWAAKKATAGAITSDQIEAVVAAAQDFGVLGCKVSGAGGGGFMMFVANPDRREALADLLAGFGGQTRICRLEPAGVRSWTDTPAGVA